MHQEAMKSEESSTAKEKKEEEKKLRHGFDVPEQQQSHSGQRTKNYEGHDGFQKHLGKRKNREIKAARQTD